MRKGWLRFILAGAGILFLSAHALSPFTLTTLLQEENSQAWHQQAVQVRGFLYQTPARLLVLAAQPDLKSCCVGTASQLAHQIIVKGSLESAPLNQAVTLHGLFKIDPLYNAQDKLTQLYVLEQAVLVSSSSFPFLTLGAIVCLILFLAVFFIKKFFKQ